MTSLARALALSIGQLGDPAIRRVLWKTLGLTLAIFAVLGWGIGAIECVCLTIIIGLSIDYCLHLGHSYTHAYASDRYKRTRNAVADVGSSVFGASMTTVVSMLVLLLCTIKIFNVIGTIIAVTILLAVAFSLGTFAAMLSMCGPEGNSGNVFFWKHRSHEEKMNKLKTSHGTANSLALDLLFIYFL